MGSWQKKKLVQNLHKLLTMEKPINIIGMPTVNWTALFGLVNAVGIFFYPDVV